MLFCQMMLYRVAVNGSFGVEADPRVRPRAGAPNHRLETYATVRSYKRCCCF